MVNRKSGPQIARIALFFIQCGAIVTTCAAGQNLPPAPQPGATPGNNPATPQSAPLTMRQCVDLARSNNPTLLSAQQNLFSVKAQELQAAVRQNPYLTASAQNITLGEYANNPYFYSAGVGRLFERGNKRGYRIDVAKSTTVQTDAQLQLTIQQTELSVKDAFTNLIIAKAAKKLADDNLSEFKHEVDINHERYLAGDLAKIDYERLDLQLAQFETDESNAIVSAEQASEQLQVLLGYDRPHTGFDIVGEVVPPVMLLQLTDLEQKGLAARPDLKAAVAGIAVADAEVKLAYANGTADPTAEVDYNRNGPDNSVGFSVNVPLRIFDKNQGNKATAKFTAQASRFDEIATRNQVISDVDQAYIGYINAKILADRYHGHYLDEAKDVLDIAQFSYDHGGLALLDYLDALRDNRTVNAAALNAYQQSWLAIHQLSFVTATEVAP
jgi:outer membrane protein, heavy metal efflux system